MLFRSLTLWKSPTGGGLLKDTVITKQNLCMDSSHLGKRRGGRFEGSETYGNVILARHVLLTFPTGRNIYASHKSARRPPSWLATCKQPTSWLVCSKPIRWLAVRTHPSSWLVTCNQPTSWLVCHKPIRWLAVRKHPSSWLVTCNQPATSPTA